MGSIGKKCVFQFKLSETHFFRSSKEDDSDENITKFSPSQFLVSEMKQFSRINFVNVAEKFLLKSNASIH